MRNPYNLQSTTLKGSLPEVVGEVIFVDSSIGNANAEGSMQKPYNSIENAFNRSGLSAGDVIVVLPDHVETVTAAGGLDADVAGVTVIGMGSGSNRPKINFTTATTASMTVDAANITFQNILFTGGIDALVNPIHVKAADFKLLDCETRDVTGQATDFIVTTAAADRMKISNWTHMGAAAAGADTALSIVGGDGIIVEDFYINGNFAVAAIENVTTLTTNITICGNQKNSYIYNRNAADTAVVLAATSTGFVGPYINARLTDNAANITEAFVGAAAVFFQPINIVNLAGESSMQTNITASTDA